MKPSILALACLTVACGAADPTPAVPTQATPEATSTALDDSLARYRSECRAHFGRRACDVAVEFMLTSFADDTLARCDAMWVGTVLTRRILVRDEILNWTKARRDLLVAHEAEHCIRGVRHDESGEAKLMRPNLLSAAEGAAKNYREWLKQSFVAPAGDPTAL